MFGTSLGGARLYHGDDLALEGFVFENSNLNIDIRVRRFKFCRRLFPNGLAIFFSLNILLGNDDGVVLCQRRPCGQNHQQG